VHRPKPYWCPELGMLRDKKRCWWNLWVQNGRPRSGVVYECWKGVKKLFRQASRKCMNNVLEVKYHKLNQLYRNRKMGAFWNFIKMKQKRKPVSSLENQQLAYFYADVMQDQGVLTEEHENIARAVRTHYDNVSTHKTVSRIQAEQIKNIIPTLGKNCAPGCDGVTAEHLIYGLSDILCEHLAFINSAIMSFSVVPNVFTVGIIVPILKKPTLDPNCPSNYRPVTLSSVHSKMLESLMLPDDDVSDSQFGFRKGRGTSFGCSLLNDIMAEFKASKSPVFLCSLDAEKCFDSIWHDALFYKLRKRIPDSEWVLLFRWYTNLKAAVK
jgi:hypothetical protein